MLRRIMKDLTQNLVLGLEDLLGDLWHARRRGDLGRLALVSYYEVRRWALQAGARPLAEQSSALVKERPYPDRASFLARMDRLIEELERILLSQRGLTAGATDQAPPSAHDALGLWRPVAPARSATRH